MKSVLELGKYLQSLRKERKLSLREVSDHLGIDLSLLSKIENGERHLQSHMLKGLSELYGLNYKELQIEFLKFKLDDEYGDEPFILEAVSKFIATNDKN